MAYTALIVDDDVKIAALLKAYFEKDGFIVILSHDGGQAVQIVREKNPDIVILDIMLPGLDGWEVCRRLRRNNDVPIIMLTARDEETDRLIGLEIGADDYVTKPFSPREVVARARAILRRLQRITRKPDVIRIGHMAVHLQEHIVTVKEQPIELTPTEFKILELLATNPGRVFSRLQIVEQVQGFSFEGYDRTIDAHIKNLRRKLEPQPKEPQLIQTVYGVGYKLAGDGME
ncbi:DNA-binding response regulator [Acetonema longum DSM 6540]|uniref:DNA-binding response regulator n=2 Tax=Acetonema TaxID=2373 RepID=F7NK39_9FIRM|nr:DNA-binding response regulator [Acetonema longum DSM 6540]